MQASFYIIVRNSFSMNFSICGSNTWWSCAHMVRLTALDIHDGHVGGQHDVSETLYKQHVISDNQFWLHLCQK